MPAVPHPYDNTARRAVHGPTAPRSAERTGAAPRSDERPSRPAASPIPVSDTAVSQADGAA